MIDGEVERVAGVVGCCVCCCRGIGVGEGR